MEVQNTAQESESAGFSEDAGADYQDKAESNEYYCGVWKFRPKCLQIFRNPYFFSFLLCCDIFIGGALATGRCMCYKAY